MEFTADQERLRKGAEILAKDRYSKLESDLDKTVVMTLSSLSVTRENRRVSDTKDYSKEIIYKRGEEARMEMKVLGGYLKPEDFQSYIEKIDLIVSDNTEIVEGLSGSI